MNRFLALKLLFILALNPLSAVADEVIFYDGPVATRATTTAEGVSEPELIINPGPQVPLQRDEEDVYKPIIEELTFTPVTVVLDPIQKIDLASIRRPVDNNSSQVTVNISAGSEKSDWMNAAWIVWSGNQTLFNQLDTDKRANIEKIFGPFNKINKQNSLQVNGRSLTVVINIDSKGSFVAADHIVQGGSLYNEHQVWSPASSAARDYLADHFQGQLFLSQESLLTSPMVFATREDTQKSIDQSLQKTMSFNTLAEAFDREYVENFSLIPNSADSLFEKNFAFTTPGSSNSGTLALLVMAYEYFFDKKGERSRGGTIKLEWLTDPAFSELQKEFQQYIRFIKAQSEASQSSTGFLAEVLMGKSRTIESAFIYENLALDAIDVMNRVGNNPTLAIRYPKFNIICDHPYYILRHSTTANQEIAAKAFRDFLLSEKPQRLAMSYGFRPVSDAISIAEFSAEYADVIERNGAKVDLTTQTGSKLIPNHSAQVIRALLQIYDKVPSTLD